MILPVRYLSLEFFMLDSRGAESAATWPHVARQVQKSSGLAGRYSQNLCLKYRKSGYLLKEPDLTPLNTNIRQVLLNWYYIKILGVHRQVLHNCVFSIQPCIDMY